MATFVKIFLLVILIFANIVVWQKAFDKDISTAFSTQERVELPVQLVNENLEIDSLSQNKHRKAAQL